MPPNGKKIQKNYKINIRKLEKKLESEKGSRIERGGESETELGRYRTGERKRQSSESKERGEETILPLGEIEGEETRDREIEIERWRGNERETKVEIYREIGETEVEGRSYFINARKPV